MSWMMERRAIETKCVHVSRNMDAFLVCLAMAIEILVEGERCRNEERI